MVIHDAFSCPKRTCKKRLSYPCQVCLFTTSGTTMSSWELPPAKECVSSSVYGRGRKGSRNGNGKLKPKKFFTIPFPFHEQLKSGKMAIGRFSQSSTYFFRYLPSPKLHVNLSDLTDIRRINPVLKHENAKKNELVNI